MVEMKYDRFTETSVSGLTVWKNGFYLQHICIFMQIRNDQFSDRNLFQLKNRKISLFNKQV